MTEIVLSGLAILLIASNLFWMFVCHRLIDKLMSRNFYEYQQTKMMPKSQEQELAEALRNVKIDQHTPSNELDSLDELIKKVMPLG